MLKGRLSDSVATSEELNVFVLKANVLSLHHLEELVFRKVASESGVAS